MIAAARHSIKARLEINPEYQKVFVVPAKAGIQGCKAAGIALDPRFRGCNPIGLHRLFATNFAIPAQAGIQVLMEAWVPACAGTARKGKSRIVTMFVEANWVTASLSGGDV
jgi:hypothetical protein